MGQPLDRYSRCRWKKLQRRKKSWISSKSEGRVNCVDFKNNPLENNPLRFHALSSVPTRVALPSEPTRVAVPPSLALGTITTAWPAENGEVALHSEIEKEKAPPPGPGGNGSPSHL